MKNYCKIYLYPERGGTIVVHETDEIFLHRLSLGCGFSQIKYVNERERPHRLDGPAVIMYDVELYMINGAMSTKDACELAYQEYLIEKMAGES